MNRVARRSRVFREPSDLVLFHTLLAELPGRFGARIHGYALMGNHFHLAISCPDAPLRRVMAWFGSNLASRKNRVHGWDGPMFRGRYRNRLVIDEGYWRYLLAYIHLNPVRSGLLAHPDESNWTSHRAYAGLDAVPPWLHIEEHLALFGSSALYREVIDELVAGTAVLPDEFHEDFVWRSLNTGAAQVAYPSGTVRTLSQDEALAQVAELTEVEVASLLVARRGREGNLPRTLAAWWLCRGAGMSRKRAGKILNMSEGSVGAAGYRVRKGEGRLGQWRELLMERFWEPSLSGKPDDW